MIQNRQILEPVRRPTITFSSPGAVEFHDAPRKVRDTIDEFPAPAPRFSGSRRIFLRVSDSGRYSLVRQS